VTDANVVLGRMGTGRSLGGAIRLDARRAWQAVERLAATLADMGPERLADGIVRIAVARMTSSIREISVERGHDPRDFTLVAFGGAGPMHAIPVAEELGIRRVLVPRHPGNFSALGLLVADVKHDDVRTRLGPLHQTATIVETALTDMEAAARASPTRVSHRTPSASSARSISGISGRRSSSTCRCRETRTTLHR